MPPLYNVHLAAPLSFVLRVPYRPASRGVGSTAPMQFIHRPINPAARAAFAGALRVVARSGGCLAFARPHLGGRAAMLGIGIRGVAGCVGISMLASTVQGKSAG
jgi:hypothetical protein